MPKKPRQPLPKRPKAVRKGPSLSQEPSKPLEAPYVSETSPDRLVAVQPMTLPPVLRLPSGQEIPAVVGFGQVRDFDTAWGVLSPRQKEQVRAMAEERGVTLQGLYGKFPQLWPDGRG